MKTKKSLYNSLFIVILLFSNCSSDEYVELKEDTPEKTINSINTNRLTSSDAVNIANRHREKIFSNVTRADVTDVDITTVSTNELTRGCENNDTLYYILNYKNDTGFAIVSADKRMSPLHAISDEGNLELSDTVENKGLALFFRNLNNNYIHNSSIIGGGGPTSGNDSTVHNINLPERVSFTVKPLLSPAVRQWGQTEPFNFLCPIIPGINLHGAVGCMALSLGQMLSYYKYPETIDGVPYNWDIANNVNGTIGMQTYRLLSVLGSNKYLNLNYTYFLSDNTTNRITWGNESILPSVLPKLGYKQNQSINFNEYTASQTIRSKDPLLVYSNITTSNLHAWVMDGVYFYSETWKLVDGSTETSKMYLFHCVWGYSKKGDGYFEWKDGKIGGAKPSMTEEGEYGNAATKYYNLHYYILQKK